MSDNENPGRQKAQAGGNFCGGIIGIIIGAILLNVGLTQGNAQCEVELARWAVIFGAMEITAGGLAVVSSLASAAAPSAATAATALGGVTGCTGLAVFGLFIWGTVLALGNDRWNRVMVSPPVNETVCAMELYKPVSIIIIVMWSLAGLVIPLACCAICLFGAAAALGS